MLQSSSSSTPLTRDEMQLYIAPRDEILAELLQRQWPASRLSGIGVFAHSEQRRVLEAELTGRYEENARDSDGEESDRDIVSEYARMVALFTFATPIASAVVVASRIT